MVSLADASLSDLNPHQKYHIKWANHNMLGTYALNMLLTTRNIFKKCACDSCVLLSVLFYSWSQLLKLNKMCLVCMCYKRTGSSVRESNSSKCRVDAKDNGSSLDSVGWWLKLVVALQYEGMLDFCLITVAVFYYGLFCSLSFVHFAIALGPSFSCIHKRFCQLTHVLCGGYWKGLWCIHIA